MGRRWSGSIRQDLVQGRPGSRRGLDAGCGTGENAIFLLRKDIASLPSMLLRWRSRKARIKARQRGFQVAFEVADARELMAGMDDSRPSLTPAVSRNERERRPSAVCKCARRVSRPGAVLHLLAFKDRGPLWLQRLGTWLRLCISGFGTHGSRKKRFEPHFRWVDNRVFRGETLRLGNVPSCPHPAGLSSDERAREHSLHNQKCDLLPCPGIGFHSRVGSSVQYVCLRGKAGWRRSDPSDHGGLPSTYDHVR